MAIVNHTSAQVPNGTLITWAAMANGDTGSPVSLPSLTEKSLDVLGTFGAGGSISGEGSNVDPPVTYHVLNDPDGNALTFTSAALKMVREASMVFRPHVTAGDGTTALTAVLLVMRTHR